MNERLKLRCLSGPGLREFEEYLKQVKIDNSAELPVHLLNDFRYSTEFPLGDVEFEKRAFADRSEFAAYVDKRFQVSGILEDVDVEGVWEWLTLLYFDDVCPVQPDGNRKVGRLVRYLLDPASESRKPSRHLLRGAYLLHRQFGSSNPAAIELLMGYPIDNYPLVWTHLNERPSIGGSLGVLDAARELFFDAETGRAKRGSGSSTADIRRFGKCVANLPIEFDLPTLSSSTVLALLPPEFDMWIDDRARRSEIQDARRMLVPFTDGADAVADDQREEQALRLGKVLVDLSGIQRASVSCVRQLRRDAFRPAVLKAYDSRCAVSGIGLVHDPNVGERRYEVEVAHVKPVANGGADLVANGIALSRTVHWAFDNGMIWIDSNFRINVTPKADANHRNVWLKEFNGRRLALPRHDELKPSKEALHWHALKVAEVENS